MHPSTVTMLMLCLGLGGLLHAGLPVKPTMSPGLRQLVLEGHGHYQKQEYDLARKVFQQASDYAVGEGNVRYLPRIRSNIGATFLAVQQYQNALPYFLEARVTARAQNDPETDAAACVNLAAIYMAIGDGDAAAESLEAAAAIMPAGTPSRARLMAQRARLEYRRGSVEPAVARMGEALAEAQSAGDRAAEGLIWDDLAMLRMDAEDLAGAETALSNEYRLWALFHTPNPEHLEVRIARLRLLQGRAEESLTWLYRAEVHARRSPGSMTPHEWEHDVALALEAAGRKGEALQAARRAWRWSSEWRREALPAQSAQLVADVTQGELAEHYAKLAGDDVEHRGEVFLAVERSRAASLRYAILNRPVMRERLGPEYLQTLTQSRERTAQWINSGDMGREPTEIGKLRARLAEIETGAGLPPAIADLADSGLVKRLSGQLGPGAALFSFQMGQPDSNLWVLTSQGLTHATLPGRAELTEQIERFRESIEANDQNVMELAARLYGVLFGCAPQAAIGARVWYLSLDDALLALPFSALRPAAAPEGRWLVESHRLTVVPSAFWLLHPARPLDNGRLLAVGDAVHNSADPRYEQAAGTQREASLGFGDWLRRTDTVKRSQLELPTLAGSGAELDEIAALWRSAGQTADVLSGLRASEADFAEALGRRPGTVHFATHVIPMGREDSKLVVRQHTRGDGGGLRVVARPDDAFLALSMRPGGERDGINTASVPAYDLPGSLVVLNGCSSALGRMQSHAGLMGFARAWLSAGASSVIASLWPLSDDSGTLFESFYKARLSRRSASESLQIAQLEMIRGQGWRAEARHWAAYISAGQE